MPHPLPCWIEAWLPEGVEVPNAELFWVNTFMLYAMLRLHAPAGELLKFQSFGWFSILCLIGFQVNTYGFTAQQDTLGIMLTLLGLSAYLGFVP